MNRQDQQAIDDLFQHLDQSAAQAGPRDPEAEARIQQHIQRDPPGLVYQMAQTLVGQQAALRQLRAQLAASQQQLRQLQQGGRWAGFGRRGRRGASQQSYRGGYACSAVTGSSAVTATTTTTGLSTRATKTAARTRSATTTTARTTTARMTAAPSSTTTSSTTAAAGTTTAAV